MTTAAQQPTTESRVSGLKVPPHSIEAEQAVIGAALLDKRAAVTVRAMLVEEDFYRGDHRLLYRAIATVVDRGDAPDPMVVSRMLEGRRESRGIDLSYVAEIVEAAPGVSNTAAYCRIVQELATRRSIIAAANQIADLGFQGGDTAVEDAQKLGATLGHRAEEGEGASMRDALRRWVEAFEGRRSGQRAGVSTGHRDLDDRWNGLQPGKLIVIGGRPAMGKTTLGMDLAENVAASGGPVSVFSLEMPEEELLDRTVARFADLDGRDLQRGKVDDAGWSRMTAGLARIRDLPLTVDDTPSLHVLQVRARARRQHATQGLSLVVIDYLQLMRGDGRTRAEEIGDITRNLKAMAKELRCPVVVLSQLNRQLEARPVDQRRPRMSDLRESGDIEQDADIIAFCYRHEVYEPTTPRAGIMEVLTAKQRAGIRGDDYLHCDLSRSTLTDTAPGFTPPPEKLRPMKSGGRDDDDL